MTKEGPPLSQQHGQLVSDILALNNKPNIDVVTARNALVIKALQFRAAGDGMIYLRVTGESGDAIDDYSNNWLTVGVLTSGNIDGTSDTHLTLGNNLQTLRQLYRINIALLVGTPDQWIPEDPGRRAARLIGRIILIDKGIQPTLNYGRPTTKTDGLNKLKGQAAESVFTLWSEGKISKESIGVRDEGSYIDVTLKGGQRSYGFKLKSIHMPAGSKLRELVNAALANQSRRRLG